MQKDDATVNYQASFEPPRTRSPDECGAPPLVIVRTIEETRRDQAFHADELQRKAERKAEADRLAASLRQESVMKQAENRHSPSIEYTHEQLKYQKMWEKEQYRAVAPGESTASVFMEVVQPPAGSQVIDFGAGTGRGALMLAILGNCKVHMLDFANNSLDEDVRNALRTQAHMLEFTQHDLNKPAPLNARFGYCTDVLEHIPPDEVDRVLQNILQAAEHVFFQISCEDDVCGALIGEPLHLSVHPHAWWLRKFQELDVQVHWSRDHGKFCMFYVTAWTKGEKIPEFGVLNIAEQSIIDHVSKNLEANWNEIQPYAPNDLEVMILCGGPSLNEHVDEIKAARAAGMKLITLNGTYNWALGHGLIPSAQIVVDAREFNARFTKPVVDECRYLIASQCHPSVLEGLPHDRTYLWHTSMPSIRETVNAKRDAWYGVFGGSTVTLRAIPLLAMLGYRKFHVYGFDSCIMSTDVNEDTDTGGIRTMTTDRHHSYSQPENDGQPVIPCTVGDRLFKCHLWHISQAQEFQDLIRAIGSEIDLAVYGDGLIAHILKTGAKMSDDALGKPFDMA